MSGSAAGSEQATFEERSALNTGLTSAAFGGGFGLFVSAIQNSIGKHNQGALGIFTRSGRTIALFTAVAGVFGFTDSFTANLRQKNDTTSVAAGGCAAGLVAGISVGSIPTAFGACAAMATLVGTFDAAGRSLTGPNAPAPPTFTTLLRGNSEDGEHSSNPGELGSRAERQRRRTDFFKPKKELSAEE